jgi:hypothetical protein
VRIKKAGSLTYGCLLRRAQHGCHVLTPSRTNSMYRPGSITMRRPMRRNASVSPRSWRFRYSHLHACSVLGYAIPQACSPARSVIGTKQDITALVDRDAVVSVVSTELGSGFTCDLHSRFLGPHEPTRHRGHQRIDWPLELRQWMPDPVTPAQIAGAAFAADLRIRRLAVVKTKTLRKNTGGSGFPAWLPSRPHRSFPSQPPCPGGQVGRSLHSFSMLRQL